MFALKDERLKSNFLNKEHFIKKLFHMKETNVIAGLFLTHRIQLVLTFITSV